jgi:outer membrane protein assembly factor BamB
MLRSLRSFTSRIFQVAAVTLVLAAGVNAPARVVARHTAQLAGLERAWFTQAPLDPSTQSVVGAQLSGGSLYVLSSSGMLQALDAETGAARWSVRLGGGENTVVLGPTVLHDTVRDDAGVETARALVAVTVGSTLHVLREVERGVETLMTVKVDGSPAAAPAFGVDVVYVPVVSGRMTGYPLDQVLGVPFIIASPGELDGTPVVAAGRVIWTTVGGQVYGAPLKGGGDASYRFDATEPLSGPPSVIGETMYFSTVEGIVYARSVQRARELWRASVGDDVRKPVVAVDGVVYVASEAPALYAFDAATGERLWIVEGLSDFVSATDKRVFAVTPDGAVGVLDRATGRPIASWPAAGALSPITNTKNDRLYFVSDDGLIQCFHEEGLAKPLVHGAAPSAESDKAEGSPVDGASDDELSDEVADDQADAGMEEDLAAEPEDDSVDPFALEDDAEGAADTDEDTPADDSGDEDDPFADF